MTAGCNSLLTAGSCNDYFLVGNPTHSYFKKIYKKYTNFCSQHRKLPFTDYKNINGNFIPISNCKQINFGSTIKCRIPPDGDLLSNLYLCINLPVLTEKFVKNAEKIGGKSFFTLGINNSASSDICCDCSSSNSNSNSNSTSNSTANQINGRYFNQNSVISWVNSIGFAIIDYVEILIGGQKIDRHTGSWLNIWYEMSGKKNGYIGKYNEDEWLIKGIYNNAADQKLVIPLQFHFCREFGLALPLIAISEDVEIIVKLNDYKNCIFNRHLIKSDNKLGKLAGPLGQTDSFDYPIKDIEDAYLIGNFIYLDTEEKRKFKASSHEYLIEQLQVVNYFPNQASPNFLPYAASFDSSKNLTPSIINLHNKISNPIKEKQKRLIEK